MNARIAFVLILCLFLIMGSCASEKAGPEKEESEKQETEKSEVAKTHLGDCILFSPSGDVPENLYRMGNIVQTDEYKPFTKKLSVYGIVLIGRDDISDDFMHNVAQAIKEMFPQEKGGVDPELQKEVLTNFYRYRAVIPFFLGDEHDFAPKDGAAWELTTSQNSICDIIMKGVSGQVNEVVEHILHYVTDIGLHYTFPDEWGISKTSKVYQAMQEAIEKEYYIIEQYEERDEEVKNRVLIQEFAYWLIGSGWNFLGPYAPDLQPIIKNKDKVIMLRSAPKKELFFFDMSRCYLNTQELSRHRKS